MCESQDHPRIVVPYEQILINATKNLPHLTTFQKGSFEEARDTRYEVAS